MLATINEVLPSSYKVFLNRRCYKTEVRFVQKRNGDPTFKVGAGVRIMEDGHMLPVEIEHCHRCHVIREMTCAQQVIINKLLNKTLKFIRFVILNPLYPSQPGNAARCARGRDYYPNIYPNISILN